MIHLQHTDIPLLLSATLSLHLANYSFTILLRLSWPKYTEATLKLNLTPNLFKKHYALVQHLTLETDQTNNLGLILFLNSEANYFPHLVYYF